MNRDHGCTEKKEIEVPSRYAAIPRPSEAPSGYSLYAVSRARVTSSNLSPMRDVQRKDDHRDRRELV